MVRAMFSAEHEDQADREAEVMEAFEKATRLHRFCPNRVWAIAQSLPGKERNLPVLFPTKDNKTKRLFINLRNHRSFEHDSHSRCTYKFCERSQINFTSVPQRHESKSCEYKHCELIKDRFDKTWLDISARAGRSTAWHLNGNSVTLPNQSYMAVSHVWSDGTGAGAWPDGQVNRCLYGFFASIARQLGCNGIWWDTICIPREKKARAKAISSMHENYENAKATLVHDCFLRDLEWIDAEAACLAIVMSPWFSRGWTALELAKSRTVKILFKKEDGLTMKDLDEDILSFQGSQSERHKVLADAIGQLRDEKITDLNRLLAVLGPRHTSWSRDMAVIAGLLVGVPVEPAIGSSDELYQQDIYQSILRSFHTLRHGHLFHNSPVSFNGVSWCPTSLFDLPLPSTLEGQDRCLEVRSNGDLLGMWNTVSLRSIPDESYIWKDVHPLIEPRLRSSLRQESDHMFLVEPGASSFNRALLVKKKHGAVQLIGYVYAHPPQRIQQAEQERIIRILNTGAGEISQLIEHQTCDPDIVGNDQSWRQEDGFGIDHIPREQDSRALKNVNAAARQSEHRYINARLLHVCNDEIIDEIRQRIGARANFDSRDSPGRTLLSRAAEEGNNEAVDLILRQYEQPLVMDDRDLSQRNTVLTPAELFEALDSKDGQNMTALSWAAQVGHAEIVEKLILWAEVDINSTSRPPDMSNLPLIPHGGKPRRHLATPLFLAAENGHERVVKTLLDAGAYLNGWRKTEFPLHAASARGHLKTVILLLRAGAKIDAEGTYNNSASGTALYIAAQNSHEKVVELLLRRGANLNVSDFTNQGSLVGAAILNGQVEIVELLLNAAVDQDGWLNSKLHLASSEGQHEIVELLLLKGAKINIQDSFAGSPLQAASTHNWTGALPWETEEEKRKMKRGNSFKTVQLLLSKGSDVNMQGGHYGNALQAASAGGYLHIVELLLSHGADVKAKGGYHGTAIQAAKSSGHKEVVKVLRSKSRISFPW